MMFEHPLGTPLGLHRKPSRVETAKRFWRVSLILSDGERASAGVCVCARSCMCVCKEYVLYAVRRACSQLENINCITAEELCEISCILLEAFGTKEKHIGSTL